MLNANREMKNLGVNIVFFITTFLAVSPKNSGKVNGGITLGISYRSPSVPPAINISSFGKPYLSGPGVPLALPAKA